MSSFYLTADDTSLEERLRKGSLEGVVKITGHGGHGQGGNKEGSEHKRLNPEVKASVGVLANILGNKAVGQLTGIQPGVVGKYKNGKDSAGRIDPDHKARVEARVGEISEKATSALELAIDGLLDPSRLADTKARDLGSIAANLSSVVERLRGKNQAVLVGQVIVMSPPQEEVRNYEVVEVESRVLD